MTQCKVQLLHNTPLYIGATGARTCWDSGDKSDSYRVDNGTYCGPKDAELLDRVGNKFKHASILEHLVYTFYISGISRALLQELSRHRIASPSVKSTRYTLKELKTEEPFTTGEDRSNSSRIAKYLVLTDVEIVDDMSVKALENLRQVIASGISNDKAKYCMPEAYRTEEQLTINARSLQNFLRLRSDKAALWEIRELAQVVYDALPEDHKYLFTHCLKESHE